jgi:hypothetical protein
MNTMDAPTQPMAAACPKCGTQLALPYISPETLYFELHDHPAPRCVLMGQTNVAFAHRNAIYAMPVDDWQHFNRLREAA